MGFLWFLLLELVVGRMLQQAAHGTALVNVVMEAWTEGEGVGIPKNR
jgi:hypothetical protein